MTTYGLLSLAVIGLMACDVAIGATVALGMGEFKSSLMRRGFWKKCAEIFALFALLLAEQVARMSGVDLALPFGFLGGAGYISAMECASIIENLRNAFGDLPGGGEGEKDDD